jgi:hypothetical protein
MDDVYDVRHIYRLVFASVPAQVGKAKMQAAMSGAAH